MIEELKHLWTVDQINDKFVIDRRWWHNPIQTWKHYARNVRLMKYINGARNTVYAGGWTLVVSRDSRRGRESLLLTEKNTYEFACISGVAAAYRLGVPYEGFDEIAQEVFSAYLYECHGIRYKNQKQETETNTRWVE